MPNGGCVHEMVQSQRPKWKPEMAPGTLRQPALPPPGEDLPVDPVENALKFQIAERAGRRTAESKETYHRVKRDGPPLYSAHTPYPGVEGYEQYDKDPSRYNGRVMTGLDKDPHRFYSHETLDCIPLDFHTQFFHHEQRTA